MQREKDTPVNPPRRRKREPGPIPADRERFATLLHTMVLRFGALQDEINERLDTATKEWRNVRGLLTMSEERTESIESRLSRLEALLSLPADPTLDQLRGILANHGPALDALGVKPLPGSVVDSRRQGVSK